MPVGRLSWFAHTRGIELFEQRDGTWQELIEFGRTAVGREPGLIAELEQVAEGLETNWIEAEQIDGLVERRFGDGWGGALELFTKLILEQPEKEYKEGRGVAAASVPAEVLNAAPGQN
jgi:hypothetical protein